MARPRTRQAAAVKTPEAALTAGLYFTDGQKLYRVMHVLERFVELEDCGDPDGLPEFVQAAELAGRMRLVRPA